MQEFLWAILLKGVKYGKGCDFGKEALKCKEHLTDTPNAFTGLGFLQ